MLSYSTLTLTGGSSIDGNTAGAVSSPACLLSPLSSWLIRQGAIDARSLRKRNFAMLELGGDAALACVPARRMMEEAPTCLTLPR